MEFVCPGCQAPLDRKALTGRPDASLSCPSCGKIVLLAMSPPIGIDLQTTMPGTYEQGTSQGASQQVLSDVRDDHAGEDETSEQLGSVGRYQLVRPLGHGGFGDVYLAHDAMLGRDVAIKLPRRDQFTSDSRFEQFVHEARMAAQLRHPAIVTVHDVDQTADGAYYIVLEYLPGGTLREMLERRRLNLLETVQLFVQVADAVAYANAQGLIHRDLKPSNILLDGNGRPYVADFGLAFISSAPKLPLISVVGTPAYMAPEQVLGETHRIDCRTDVWGLGVILYWMLAGRLPFYGTETEIFAAILRDDPPRLVDCNPTVPSELERICVKCLSKRMTERYESADKLAADLRDWMGSLAHSPTLDLDQAHFAAGAKQGKDRASPDAGGRSTLAGVKVIPKGLRFFTEQDAHFYLDLLPGARDRDGLPESIRFWKQALEATEPGQCFRVGLLFGPSGCGKTSFLKAGVVPLLEPHVLPIYFETTADAGESRLVALLRRHFPSLPDTSSLPEILALLRDNDFVPQGKKLVLILDQFEQWLYQGRRGNGDLVPALRQCDGVRVQCLLSVRDDFGMAVTRFLDDLEVPIVQGFNFGTVDRFDLRHARKVLSAFGRAFGQLPQTNPPSAAQQRFLDQAVQELAEEDRVIPVRLSLFAEMIKNSPWTPETLRRVGGAEGLGVTFLEETFSQSSGNPVYRRHADAARRALQEFLPEHGGNIRGRRVARERLAEVIGYQDRAEDMHTLLRVLAHELRLITPADPENETRSNRDNESGQSFQSSRQASSAESFQLMHDYLVPAIRTWLNRGQRATRRGRAQLCLAERAAQWQSHPEPRFLPSFLEWTGIILHTRARDRTTAQQLMMHAASKYYGQRLLATAALILVVVAGLVHYEHRRSDLENRAISSRTLQSLQTAETTEVPRILDELKPYQQYTGSALHKMAFDPSAPFRHRLHATLALLRSETPITVPDSNTSPTAVSDHLVSLLPEASAAQLAAICGSFSRELSSLGPDCFHDCWRSVLSDQESPNRQLRVAGLLTAYPDDQRWTQASARIVKQLSLENPVQLPHWLAAFKPVARALIPEAQKIFGDTSAPIQQRTLAAEILATYVADDPKMLVKLIRSAERDQFPLLLDRLRQHSTAMALLNQELEHRFEPSWPDLVAKSDWQEVTPATRTELEKAHGDCQPAFAYCQSLPLDRFDSVAGELKVAGFRPNLFRPYATPTKTLVAVIWERDGKDWQVSYGRTVQELREDDERFRQMGYFPVDVAEETGNESPEELRFSGLWVQDPPGVTDAKLYVYIPESEHQDYWEPLNSQRFLPRTNLLHRPSSDQPHYTSVRWRFQGALEYLDTWDGSSEDLTVRDGLKWPMADVRLSQQKPPSFSAIWWDGGGNESKSLVGQPLNNHSRDCLQLVELGWRPRAFSAAWDAANNGIIAASLWHRPNATHHELDEFAKERANIVAALLACEKGGRSHNPVSPSITVFSQHRTSTTPPAKAVVPHDNDQQDVWSLLCSDREPRSRAWLIENLTPLLGDPTADLLGQLSQEESPTARAAILLALVPAAERGLLTSARNALVPQLEARFRKTAYATERSAAFALLRALQAGDSLPSNPVREPPAAERDWFTTTAGNTMVTIRGPTEITMGAGGDDPDREPYFETRHRVTIPRSFAISATEVTVEEFRRFQKDHPFARDYSAQPDCPIIQVSLLDAMRYCRWLGEQEGIPENEQCYPPMDQIHDSAQLPADVLERTGYRLPTEAEWECACRAGTELPRPFGHSSELLERYAWTAHNSKYHAWPVATRLPNSWGLFDMLGNVGELTMSDYRPYPKPSTVAVVDEGNTRIPKQPVWRGGAFLYQPSDARCSHRSRFSKPDSTEVSVGFRIARTMRSSAMSPLLPGEVGR